MGYLLSIFLPLLFLSRGGMIQTSEQYQFVHHVMSLFEKQFSRAAAEEWRFRIICSATSPTELWTELYVFQSWEDIHGHFREEDIYLYIYTNIYIVLLSYGFILHLRVKIPLVFNMWWDLIFLTTTPKKQTPIYTVNKISSFICYKI